MRQPRPTLTDPSDASPAITPGPLPAAFLLAGLTGVMAVLIADWAIPALVAWQLGGGA